MPKRKTTKLFENWTFKRLLPELFKDTNKRSTDAAYVSKYNVTARPVATLHTATLRGIIAFTAKSGAVGFNKDGHILAEYIADKSKPDEIDVVYYNPSDGQVFINHYIYKEESEDIYKIGESAHSGSAVFFALMNKALEETEFSDTYIEFSKGVFAPVGFSEAGFLAYKLCDNLYRRIEHPKGAGENAINIAIPSSGEIPKIPKEAFEEGLCIPTNVVFGEFTILQPPKKAVSPKKNLREKFINQYRLQEKRMIKPEEELMVPPLPSWYVIPKKIVKLCEHAKKTTDKIRPMRNFMLRGPAGSGKTEGARAMASAFHLPYVFMTMHPNTEMSDLLVQYLPASGRKTGFDRVDSPLIQAFRNGWLCEIQEPSCINNPAVLVGLNSLLDTCNAITLPTGETINRHPDTVVVMTTNIDYAGTKPMNQSILSRMNLIVHLEQPGKKEMLQRITNITGFDDMALLDKFYTVYESICGKCQSDGITDGVCGTRELLDWVESYMVCGDPVEAIRDTLLSKCTEDIEIQKEIESCCIETMWAA